MFCFENETIFFKSIQLIDFQVVESSLKATLLGSAGIQANRHLGVLLKRNVTHTNLDPFFITKHTVKDHEVASASLDLELHIDDLLQIRLGGPVAVSVVGDNRTQIVGFADLSLNRGLGPLLRGEVDDEAGLVVLRQGLVSHMSLKSEIGGTLQKHAMAGVSAEAVVGVLPEISVWEGSELNGLAIGLDVDRLVEPSNGAVLEAFFDVDAGHCV